MHASVTPVEDLSFPLHMEADRGGYLWNHLFILRVLACLIMLLPGRALDQHRVPAGSVSESPVVRRCVGFVVEAAVAAVQVIQVLRWSQLVLLEGVVV